MQATAAHPPAPTFEAPAAGDTITIDGQSILVQFLTVDEDTWHLLGRIIDEDGGIEQLTSLTTPAHDWEEASA